jgi:hypothetical protein
MPKLSIYGSCKCGNIQIDWDVDDFVRAPRACQCDYCVSKNASYLSEPDSALSVAIHNPELHRVIRHGTNTAEFHECSACNTLVFVSSIIDGAIYGVVNSQCLDNIELELPIKMEFTEESAQERLARRCRNWCRPVFIIIKCCEAVTSSSP